MKNKETLEDYLKRKNVHHKFIEYNNLKYIDKNKIAKTIVFMNNKEEPVIVLIRSIYKVNQRKFAKLLNVKDIRLAREDEVIKYTGYKIGGVSPFDINYKIYIDRDLLNEEVIYVGGGNNKYLLEVRIEDIIKNNICEIIDIPKKSE